MYIVYLSVSPNIDTVEHAAANGTAVIDWTQDIGMIDVTSGLNENSTYYFNIIVKDESGYSSAYTQITATTVWGHYLFSAGIMSSGRLGAGAGQGPTGFVLTPLTGHIRTFHAAMQGHLSA